MRADDAAAGPGWSSLRCAKENLRKWGCWHARQRDGAAPLVSSDQHGTPSLLTPISAYRWFIEYGGRHGTRWENWVTRVIPKTPAPYHPGICAPHIKVHTLMMIAPEDEMAGASPAIARAAYHGIP